MSGEVGVKWRFLIVEDNTDIARQVIEAIPGFVEKPDTARGVLCETFDEAMKRLEDERFDVLILDLKDDSVKDLDEHDVSAGLEVFESLKRIRFSPVIFYTAHAHKVREHQTSFVRVVEKTEGLAKLKEEVTNVLGTKLPTLSRQIEEVQRSYMWGFVDKHWKQYDSEHERTDLAYLLARRLASLLQSEARALAQKVSAQAVPDKATSIHPMEMYVHPPISANRQAGDIVRGSVNGESGEWLILTPSCDFEHKKVSHVLLARCVPLEGTNEFKNWIAKDGADSEVLGELIRDRRKNVPPQRFKFLPGTFFLKDSVVDFQGLVTITLDVLAKLEVVASLDSPFAEAVLERFSRYFGRLGTPDVDKDVVLRRLNEIHRKQKPAG